MMIAHPQNSLGKQLINLFHSADLPLHLNHKGNKQFTNYQRISLVIIFRRENEQIREFISWLGEQMVFLAWIKENSEEKHLARLVKLI